MPEFRFTLTEHDPNRPWIVLRQEHRAITLDDAIGFFSSGLPSTGPSLGGRVELDPWQLTPRA